MVNLLEMLETLIEEYKKLDVVEAIALSGSSTSKTDDSKSDYDIYIYCQKEPDIEKRRKIAEKFSDSPEIDNHYFETGDTFYLRETGKPIDIDYRLPDFIESNIKHVWEEHNASMGYTTCFLYNVKHSKILYDKNGWLKNIQDKVSSPYPENLAKNIIRKNFTYLKDAMFSYRDQIASAVERNDLVSINHRSAAFLASYFDVIFAKNRLLHPGEKKLVDFAKSNCAILPQDFEQEIENLLIGDISKRVLAADKMVENLRKII